MQEYMLTQSKLKEAIKKEQKAKTDNNFKQLMQEGATKSNSFWKIRKKILNTKTPQYDTITENNEPIHDPEETREHIAKYFEDLYQARGGETKYEEWTTKIKQTIHNIEEQMNQMDDEEITIQEVKKAIKALKRKKSTGPDDIPNEIFIEANETSIAKYTEIINKIHKAQTIPKQWQHGEIITIYKGKGTKGKCSSERGITLSSNFGKLYERIINNRAKQLITITEAQAGGIKGKSTSDHIRTLNDLIHIGRENNKRIFITYLDVTKAYDKAWLDAIMYVLHKEGLKNKTWLTVKKLNEKLTASINTKYGPTRNIKIRDSIRQGGVLSVIMYATLMDEISKEIKKHNIGIKLPDSETKIGCLLWMDDVALIANEHSHMQKMLDITHEISSRYRIKFGEEKSKTITMPNRKNTQTQENFMLGEMKIEYTDKYKYLGIISNNKNNLKDHIPSITAKAEATYQTILMLAHNSNFDGIQMETIWKLLDTCIIPILTYGSETWNLSKTETHHTNKILDNLLKRLLKTPTTTPREALYIETGLLDVKAITDQKRITMETRIHNNPTPTSKALDQSENKKTWYRITQNTKQEYEITDIIKNLKQTKAKIYTKTKILTGFTKRINNESEKKSKIKFLLEGKGQWTAGKRSPYMDKLTRNECSTIFKARTRMIDVKHNFRGKYENTVCRLCKTEEETQNHILNLCTMIHKDDKLNTTQEEIFSDDTTKLTHTATKINSILKILTNPTP